MTGVFPTQQQILAELAEAEHGAGWLAVCEEAGRYLVLSRELVDALVDALGPLPGPVLEVCAGRGELAEALRSGGGLDVLAADADPFPGSAVVRAAAPEAIERFEPATVIGCFVPFDAGVDRAVLAAPSVQNYLVLGARLGGQLGSRELWNSPGWSRAPVPLVARWMITRHDVWLGPDRPLLKHGEAWLLRRTG